MKRIHGIAIANDANVGYITDGGADQAVVFDLKSLAVKQRVSTGKNPDAVCYDPTSHYIFTMNGGSQDSTVIDARSGEVVKTIPLGGKPEFAASDGKGSVYVNLEDKNQLARLDVKQMAVSAQWPLGACDSPSGLAIDRQNRRLFSVCDNKIMTVVDADSGKVVATPAIGEGPDAAAFDPGNHVALSSNGRSGTLTVVREDSADQFTVAQTVQTERGARTMTVDEKSHNIYLVTAKFGPAPPVSPSNPRPRPVIQPDSFKVLIVGQ